MKPEMFNDEPLTDSELFVMLRESFSDEESTWETVREAQGVFKEYTKRLVLKEIENERNELLTLNHRNYAA
jgi:hypothetical protein